MTSLLDIGDLSEDIPVGKVKVTVWGATPEGFFYLLDKFPPLQALFTRGSVGIKMSDFQEIAPECVAYVLAVTTVDRSACPTRAAWHEELDKAAAVARRLSASYQTALFNAALRLTFSEGIGPFIKSMADLTATIGRISGQGTVQDTTSSRPSRSGFTTDSPGLRLGRAAQSASSRH